MLSDSSVRRLECRVEQRKGGERRESPNRLHTWRGFDDGMEILKTTLQAVHLKFRHSSANSKGTSSGCPIRSERCDLPRTKAQVSERKQTFVKRFNALVMCHCQTHVSVSKGLASGIGAFSPAREPTFRLRPSKQKGDRKWMIDGPTGRSICEAKFRSRRATYQL